MAKRTTLADVAAAAGMSTTAVSMILNDRPGTRLSAEAATRVKAIAAELNYRPNPAARTLRIGKTRTVGFLSDEVTITRYASAMIRGLLDVAEERDHTVLIAETGHHAERMASAVDAMLDRRPDALVFGLMGARQIELPEIPADIPVVMLNGTASTSTPVVLPDEYAAGRAVTTLLLDAGHHEGIGTIGRFPPGELTPQVSVTIDLRFQGIDDALAEAGTGIVATSYATDWTPPSVGIDGARQLLESGADIRALIAMNDNIGFGAAEAFREAGMVLPDDVSIVSFDDEVMAVYARPKLTTARIPYEAMGRRAMELALDADQDPRKHLVPMPIVIRDSVRRS